MPTTAKAAHNAFRLVLALSLPCLASASGMADLPAAPATAPSSCEPAAPVRVDAGPLSSNLADTPPRSESAQVQASTDAGRPPAYGPSAAEVIVLVFSDFQCPVCRRSADATRQIAAEFPGEVRLEFRQHPLANHARSEDAAVASLAAQRQDLFWPYHDELFRNQGALDESSLADYAERLGMDREQFLRDYSDPDLRARVRSEAAFADEIGAGSTPAFMINGNLSVGWGSWVSFRSAVDREVNAARALASDGTPRGDIAAARARQNLHDAESFERYREQVLVPLAAGPADQGH